MSKSMIIEIPVENFNFTNFINEISENFAEEVDSEYICTYMRKSKIEEDVYVDLCKHEVEPKVIHDTYEEDLLNNDRILYVKFVIDRGLWGEEGYICGDGSEIMDEDIDYGQFINNENGFVIRSNNGILQIQRGTYGAANPFQNVLRTVENAGEFDEILTDFINKHTNK